MKNIMKTIIAVMVMAIAVVGFTPTVAEAKTSVTVVNKATGKKIKKVSLKTGQKLQLKVKYGKKNVTKKAKYKVIGKNVKVTKKGKITAKTAGSCKVKVTYKKKSKTITIAVTNAKTTTKADSKKRREEAEETRENVTMEQWLENIKTDPHPECNHEWDKCFFTKTTLSVDDFYDRCEECLYLGEVSCPKCNTNARITPVSYSVGMEYTDEDIQNAIIDYPDINCPSHKHNFAVEQWTYSPTTCRFYCSGQRCTICTHFKE